MSGDGRLIADSESSSPDVIGWCLRIGIGAFFILAGVEKFPSHPGSSWVALFDRIGIGQWFRYFTGIVELAGGCLFVIPRTVRLAGVLLGCTMVGAILVHVAVLKRPGNAVIPVAALAAVIVVSTRSPT